MSFGGTGYDTGNDLSVDNSGNLYLTGETQSSNFPVVRALEPGNLFVSGARPPVRAFLTKIALGTGRIVYSSYFGGPGMASGRSIVTLHSPDEAPDEVAIAGTHQPGNGGPFPALDPLWLIATPQVTEYVAKFRIPDTGAPKLVFSSQVSIFNRNLAFAAGGGSIYIGARARSGQFPIVAGTADPLMQDGEYVLKLVDSPSTLNVSRVVVQADPIGRSFRTQGAGCDAGTHVAPKLFQWTSGTTCQLAFEPVAALFEAQNRFKQWEDGSQDPIRTVTVPASGAPVTYTATYTYLSKIEITVDDPARGSASSAAGDEFQELGKWVPISAKAAPGWVFDRWTGRTADIRRVTQANATVKVDIGTNRLTANFVRAVTGIAPSRFVPLPPCRILDTRSPGGLALVAKSTRNINLAGIQACGTNIPANASAYSINVTVIPKGPLGYLSIVPMGVEPGKVSTLNSLDGRIKANAAIVGAGNGGRISLYATDATDVAIDVNGYFSPASGPAGLVYYPVSACRVTDTRLSTAGPAIAANATRRIPIAPACGVPADAKAFALNATAVPTGRSLGYLRILPAGATPSGGTSTLNAVTGTVVPNSAIVEAGVNGAIDVFATDETHLILDISGYFAPPGRDGGLHFYPTLPCRTMDTRNFPFQPGEYNLSAIVSGCDVQQAARVVSANVTVLPQTGRLGYITMFGERPQSNTSMLNSLDGAIASNAILLEVLSGGATVFSTNLVHMLLDVSGFFAE
jgi:hypothetical protein